MPGLLSTCTPPHPHIPTHHVPTCCPVCLLHSAGGDPATCPMWLEIRQEAACLATEEQLVGSYLRSTILNHNSLAKALSYHLSTKLEDTCFNCMQW